MKLVHRTEVEETGNAYRFFLEGLNEHVKITLLRIFLNGIMSMWIRFSLLTIGENGRIL
jgi:hypothetical protein